MRTAFFLLLNLSVILGYSQDSIFLKSGSKLCGKIMEIDNENVKYKTCSNLDGPTYIKCKADITKIRFQNGETEEYSKPESKSDNKENGSEKFYSITQKEVLLKRL